MKNTFSQLEQRETYRNGDISNFVFCKCQSATFLLQKYREHNFLIK